MLGHGALGEYALGQGRAPAAIVVTPLVYANANTFGVDRETEFLAQARFVNVNTFGVDRITYKVNPVKFANVNTFGVDREKLFLAPLKYPNANTFGVDKDTLFLALARLVNVNTFGAQAEKYTVNPVRFAEANAFGSTHVYSPPFFPTVFINVNRFGTHSLSAAGGNSSKPKSKRMGLEPVRKKKQAPPPAPLPPPPIPLPPADIIRPIEPTAPMPEPVMVGQFDPAHAAVIQHEVLSAQDEADAAAVIRSILAKRDHAHMQMLLSLI